MDSGRPPSRKGRELRKSHSGPLRAELSSSLSLSLRGGSVPTSDATSSSPHKRLSKAEEATSLSLPMSQHSPRPKPKGPKGPRPRALRACKSSPNILASEPTMIDTDESPLSPATPPPPSPRPRTALLPAIDLDLDMELGYDFDSDPFRHIMRVEAEIDPDLEGRYDDAPDQTSTSAVLSSVPHRLPPRLPPTPPLRIGTPSLDPLKRAPGPGPNSSPRPKSRRGEASWYGADLQPKPRRYHARRRRRRSIANDVIELVVAHLATLARPPYPCGREAGARARATLASIMSLSRAGYDLVLPLLYSQLVFTSTSTLKLLRTLVPPLPDSRDNGRNDMMYGAFERSSRMRYAVHCVHVEGLSFALQAAWIRHQQHDAITIADSVSLGPPACEALGKSTLLAAALARLASPLSLCVDAGECPAPVARVTVLALALTVLPAWPQLNTITLHRAAHLLVPSRSRLALFRSGIKYRLAFGPTSSPSAGWDEMVSLLRDLLENKELSDVDNIQIVLPFDASGSLPPPPSTRRTPVPRSEEDGKDKARQKAPLRPAAMLPSRSARSPSVKNKIAVKAVSDELPATARRLVCARGNNVKFVTVESLVDGLAGTTICTTCDYPWL